jgi:hypothetical protein
MDAKSKLLFSVPFGIWQTQLGGVTLPSPTLSAVPFQFFATLPMATRSPKVPPSFADANTAPLVKYLEVLLLIRLGSN